MANLTCFHLQGREKQAVSCAETVFLGSCMWPRYVGQSSLVFMGHAILRVQLKPRKVSNTFWEDILMPMCGCGGRYCKIISCQTHLSQLLPLHDFSKSRGNKKKKENTHTHTVPPPSGGLRPASTRFWQARYWQPQRPIFLFLCCCFKSKARLVMWKHNTNTLTLLGKTRVAAKAFRWRLCPPSSLMEWSLVEKLGRGSHPENAAGSPTPITMHARCQGLPQGYGRRKMLPPGPGCRDSRTPAHASKADVG